MNLCRGGELVTDIRLLADSATPPRAVALRLSTLLIIYNAAGES